MKHNELSFPFFRPEVTDPNSQIGLGAIRICQPISGWLVTGIALTIFVLFVIYITFGTITRKDKVSGITVPVGGNIGAFASNGGTVTRFLVSEGAKVKAGQPLFEISTERQSGYGEVSALVARQLLSRRASLDAERKLKLIAAEEKLDAIQKKLKTLESEKTQVQQEITLAERRAHLTQIGLSKYQTLQASGYISGFQLQQKEAELLDADARLLTLKRGELQAEKNILDTITDKKSLVRMSAVEQAQFNGSLATLEQEIAENTTRKSTYIVASQDGIVATIICEPGQIVNIGQTLAVLTPASAEKSRLEAQLYLPSRAIGFVTLGQTVLIRYHAFPYEKFGLHKGTVTDISKTPFAPNDLPVSTASTILNHVSRQTTGPNGIEGLYRIRVQLNHQGVFANGKMRELKPAMTLDAEIIQEQRNIWEWIAQPILAVAQRQRPQ